MGLKPKFKGNEVTHYTWGPTSQIDKTHMFIVHERTKAITALNRLDTDRKEFQTVPDLLNIFACLQGGYLRKIKKQYSVKADKINNACKALKLANLITNFSLQNEIWISLQRWPKSYFTADPSALLYTAAWMI